MLPADDFLAPDDDPCPPPCGAFPTCDRSRRPSAALTRSPTVRDQKTGSSINVRLEAVPVSGEMQIRDYVPRDEFAGAAARQVQDGNNGAESSSSFVELS